MRRTKIVCTIGPASSSPELIQQLIEAGMDVARLNFSHGTQENHARVIAHIREISARLGRPVAILQDLQGLKIRLGTFQGGRATLKHVKPARWVTWSSCHRSRYVWSGRMRSATELDSSRNGEKLTMKGIRSIPLAKSSFAG